MEVEQNQFELSKDHLTRYPPFNILKTGIEAVEISKMVKKGETEDLKKRISTKEITKMFRGM